MDDVCDQINRVFQPSVEKIKEFGLEPWSTSTGPSLNSRLSQMLEFRVAEVLKGAEFKDHDLWFCREVDFYG